MEDFKIITGHGIWCGILIGLGGLAYLMMGGPLGALLFSFGLICVTLSGCRCLFTGAAGKTQITFHDHFILLYILLCNWIGCGIVALIATFGEIPIDPSSIINSRLNSDYFVLFARSVGTGIIMHICVWIAKYQKNYIPILLGVPIFILCGLPHCVADLFYYSLDYNCVLDGSMWGAWGMSVLGNYVGCNLPRSIGACPEK